MKPIVFVCLFAAALLAGCRARLEPPAPAAPEVAIVPQPLEMTVGGGRFEAPAGLRFVGAGVEAGAAERAVADRQLAGFRAWLESIGVPPSAPAPAGQLPAVVFAIEPGERDRLGDEGYQLRIAAGAATLRAAAPAGLFYGTQTLRQLVMDQLDGNNRLRRPLALPCLEIVDKPRYSWRGFMLDCCRHYFPPSFIKSCLDRMALHKLNRFHWHLTEDQAWRIEIAKYPGLTAAAPFYSRQEIRDIVDYAAARFITVVPEIEMPGHATAAVTTYPELSCTGGPFARMAQWGVFADVYCAGSERTFAFLQDVLDEVTELFPGPWVHIGGDECPKDRWHACPRCQARMQAEGLKSEAELQSWFVRRVERHLGARGKRIIGWDEILEGGLAPNAAVMSWRGTEGGIAAARQGHDVVMAPTSAVYIDYYQGPADGEVPSIGGYVPLQKIYAFEPTPAELNGREAARVLGAQANLWTEFIPTPERADLAMWPRLAALSEVVWSSPERRDWNSFLARLQAQRRRLEALGAAVSPVTWQPQLSATPLFREKAWRVGMTSALGGAAARFTQDGSEPGPGSKRYRRPFRAKGGATVRAALFSGPRALAPAVAKALLAHPAAFAPVRLIPGGRLQPEGDGRQLTDGLRGSWRHDDGSWLGVEGGDLEAEVDLGRPLPVRRVACGFLDRPSSWIFPPRAVEIALSPDGRDWRVVHQAPGPVANDYTVLRRHEIEVRCAPQSARYVRLRAQNVGACPPDHTGAGGKTWVFADEIVVE